MHINFISFIPIGWFYSHFLR